MAANRRAGGVARKLRRRFSSQPSSIPQLLRKRNQIKVERLQAAAEMLRSSPELLLRSAMKQTGDCEIHSESELRAVIS